MGSDFDSDATRGADEVEPHPATVAVPALPAGTLYAGRYRIVELLGRGGMGEVYRAHDTVLDVSVALKRVGRKSLPVTAQVVREVRLARQITHRAVCRVFDVGETDGEPYITMEYVDGEDLGSLLRRIGRLPAAKAIDVARQSCAGLAAAHAHGILHRDLKPGNIMVDRRGDVRITDFGIAVEQGSAADPRIAGTPAYMAPEQLRGEPASPRSDVYALGLVLYELLTGRHAFEDQGTSPRDRGVPPPPSALVADIDPALDRLVLSALDADPNRRPASAIAFSSALPGGDVLQAALEAGQTPSPDLVASAGTTGRLSPRVGAALLIVAAGGLALIVATARVRLIDQVAMTDPPAVLAAKARDFLREVTGEPGAPNVMFALRSDSEYLEQLARNLDDRIDPTRIARLVYRESPTRIVPGLLLTGEPPFDVTLDNPPMTKPGMKAVVLDSSGRLRVFRAVPGASSTASDRPVDWRPFIRASGVDPEALTPAAPEGGAPPFGDQRFAWRGRAAGSNEAFRLEAAASSNRPTWFEVRHAESVNAAPAASAGRAAVLFGAAASLTLLLTALLLARRNLRRGRADTRGARRLASLLFTCHMGSWLLGASLLPAEVEVTRSVIVASLLLTASLLAAAVYLAFEPVVRRRWPSSLISWNRLLAGGIGDPLVGRDVLVGAVTSIAGTALYQVMVGASLGLRGDRPATVPVTVLMGTRHLLSGVLAIVPDALSSGMVLVLIYSLLVMLVRRGWLAAAAMLALLTIPVVLQLRTNPLELLVLETALALFVVVFVRFGLLSLTSYLFFDAMVDRLPLSFESGWRSEFAMVTLLTMAAVLAFASYTSISGRMRPWRDA